MHRLSPYRRDFAAIFILLGTGLFAYRASLHSFYLAEDFVVAGLEWKTVLGYAFYPGRPSFYRPLMSVPWVVGHFLWGYDPWAFHLLFLLMQVLCSFTVYGVALFYSADWTCALFSALLFQMLLPSADAVNWPNVASHTILSATAYLGALRQYGCLRQSAAGARVPLKAYTMCALLLLIALFSHEFAVTWPLAAFVLGYARQGGVRCYQSGKPEPLIARLLGRGVREVRVLLPLILLGSTFIAWRTFAVKGMGVYGQAIHLRGGWILLADLWMYVKYFLWPLSEWSMLADLLDWFRSQPPLLSALGVLVLVVIGWSARLWLAVTMILLIPMLNIPAPHRAYLPGAGYAILVGCLVRQLLSQVERANTLGRTVGTIVVSFSMLGVLAVQMQAVHTRNLEWRAAGEWGDQVLRRTQELIPRPDAGARIYFYGLPLLWKDISVFSWGLGEALRQRYGDRTLTVQTVAIKPDPNRIAIGLDADLASLRQGERGESLVLAYQENVSGDGFQLRLSSLEEIGRLASDESGNATR